MISQNENLGHNMIKFYVDKQIISRGDQESVVQDSMNYLYAGFGFSEEWGGVITAVFKGKDGQAFNVILDENLECLVPWEVLTNDYFDVSVFCGNLITANVVRIYTVRSGYEIGEESRTPTPDVYNQIIEALDNINAYTVSYENEDLGVENVGDALDVLAEGGGGGGGGVTPNIHMTAEVDATTGTPDVEVTKTGTLTNPIFNLAFSGLKGETGSAGPQGERGPVGPQGPTGEAGPQGSAGPKGDTGATPIISASATVSNTIGTPAVNVTKSGTDEAPSFAFAFSGIKGQTGMPGMKGDTGETGPQGPQGPQGPAGADGADGSVVTVTQTLSSGTKIAEIDVDGTTTNLYAPSGSGGATALSELSDVQLDRSLANGEALRYNSTSETWINAPLSKFKAYVDEENTTEYTIKSDTVYFLGGESGLSEADITLATSSVLFIEEFHFLFISGATPTELSLPSNVIVPDDFSVEANKMYEVSIMQGFLLYNSWALPETEEEP